MVLLFPTLKSISSDKCNKYKIEYKLTFKLCPRFYEANDFFSKNHNSETKNFSC